MYLSEDKFCKPQTQRETYTERDLHFDIPVKGKIFNALRVKYFYSIMDLAPTEM